MDDQLAWTLIAQQLMSIQRAVGAALLVVQEKLDSAKGQETHVPANAVKTFGGKSYVAGANTSPLPKE